MFSSDDETGIERGDGDRGGVLVNDVQLEPAGSVEEGAEDVDWEKAFNTLSCAIGREMVTGDFLYLLAHKLLDREGREAALRFAQCVTTKRGKFMQEFMG